MKAKITVKSSGPYDELIRCAEHGMKHGIFSEKEGEEIIERFQWMSVRTLTRRGPKVTNVFYTGD